MTTIRKISIPEACHQPWQQMTPNEHGRHCMHCAKKVTDFTGMTNDDIIAYLSTKSNICGRFGYEQLNQVNRHIDTAGLKSYAGWRKWMATMVLLGSTAFLKVSGQTNPITASKVEQNPSVNHLGGSQLRKSAVNSSGKIEVKGRILDDEDKPLNGATLSVVGTDMAFPTDTEGRFKFHVPTSARNVTVSFVGFETATVSIDSLKTENYEMKLRPQVIIMDDAMIIKGYGAQRRTDIVGSVVAVTTSKHSWWWRMYYKYIWTPIHQIFH
jgi:hypothetical protein